jgi:hypothetical protein
VFTDDEVRRLFTAIDSQPISAFSNKAMVDPVLLASACLPSSHITTSARAIRLATSAAAMSLVFMGAIVIPVYLVSALTLTLAFGLAAESRPVPSRALLRGLVFAHALQVKEVAAPANLQDAQLTGRMWEQDQGDQPVNTAATAGKAAATIGKI